MAKLELLKEPLLANRERYNTLFALAKRARPRLDEERFRFNLGEYLVPLVEASGDTDVVDALYDLMLELTGVELFGRSEAVRTLWTELFPTCSKLIASHPELFAPTLTNAVYNLEREDGDWTFWMNRMEQFAPKVKDHHQWLAVAQVLAWVSGLAHFKESAAVVARTLPKELAAEIVPRWDKVQDDPWWSRRPAAGQLVKVHQVGAFAGFGGVFRKPPELVCAGTDRFLVSDGTEEWLLSCDGFGATLKRVFDFALKDVAKESFDLDTVGKIGWRGRSYDFPELGSIASYDASGSVLAVTTKLSHAVHIFLGTN